MSACATALEQDFECELDVARLAEADAGRVAAMASAENQAAARERRTWITEVECVEQIEDLHAELRGDTLRDRRVLEDRKIEGLEIRPVERIALQRAKCAGIR